MGWDKSRFTPLAISDGFGQRRARHADEIRQGLDPGQPCAYRGVRLKIDATFGRVRDIAVACDVGDCNLVVCQEPTVGEDGLDHAKECMRICDRGDLVERDTENRYETCRARAMGNFSCGDAEPSLHFRGRNRRVGKPSMICRIPVRQIDEDGIGIRKHDAVIVNDRHLGEGVQSQELRQFVRATGQVDVDLHCPVAGGDFHFDRVVVDDRAVTVHLENQRLRAAFVGALDGVAVGLVDDEITRTELELFLPEEEHERLINHTNTATQIINEQSRDLSKLRKENIIEDFRHVEMMELLQKLYTLQGKNERIKIQFG